MSESSYDALIDHLYEMEESLERRSHHVESSLHHEHIRTSAQGCRCTSAHCRTRRKRASHGVAARAGRYAHLGYGPMISRVSTHSRNGVRVNRPPHRSFHESAHKSAPSNAKN